MNEPERIDKAIAAHARWKYDLRRAIESGTSEWTVEAVRADDRCEFGQWLHALPLADHFDNHWKEVRRLHAEFHEEAARVLAMALAGHKQEAEAAIALGSRFASASSKLTIGMTSWKKAMHD